MNSLGAQIAGLRELTIHDLRILWRREHGGEPPVPLTRDLMVRAIAYRMQERAHGGLAPATRRRLHALARELEGKGRDALDPGVTLRPGTRLLRDWGGNTHTVLVTEDGFEYAGERYRSLTPIATLITGAHWSGPRFFQVKGRVSRPNVAAESRNE
jgi:Protein of unknown function (DUF2924)